jgi:hypothetical protein
MRAWLLLVGDWQRAEFAAPQHWIASRQPSLVCPTVAAAVQRLGDRCCVAELGPPAGIVLAQSWPGQIDHRQIDQLHALAPLARLVGLVGPWSEGTRRGDWVWPGVEAVPWHAWQWRLPLALGLSDPSEEVWPTSLPKTATAQERIAHRLAAMRSFYLQQRLVAVVSPDPLRAEGLASMVGALGLDATCVPCGQHVPDRAQAVLVDGWPGADASGPAAADAQDSPRGAMRPAAVGDGLGPARMDGVRSCAAPKFLLLPFPRWEDGVRAKALGFAEVLALPLFLADLAAALEAHLRPSCQPAPRGQEAASAVLP